MAKRSSKPQTIPPIGDRIWAEVCRRHTPWTVAQIKSAVRQHVKITDRGAALTTMITATVRAWERSGWVERFARHTAGPTSTTAMYQVICRDEDLTTQSGRLARFELEVDRRAFEGIVEPIYSPTNAKPTIVGWRFRSASDALARVRLAALSGKYQSTTTISTDPENPLRVRHDVDLSDPSHATLLGVLAVLRGEEKPDGENDDG